MTGATANLQELTARLNRGDGTIGKLLPSFLVVGAESHVGEPFEGLDANLLAAELIADLSMNDALCDVIRRKRRHLSLEAGTADRLQQLLVGVVASQYLLRRVPHRGEDDPAGVDDGAVEVEEHDRKPHGLDRSPGPRRRACG